MAWRVCGRGRGCEVIGRVGRLCGIVLLARRFVAGEGRSKGARRRARVTRINKRYKRNLRSNVSWEAEGLPCRRCRLPCHRIVAIKLVTDPPESCIRKRLTT